MERSEATYVVQYCRTT